MVSYSLDAYKWEFARDIYGNKKVFKGNSDSHTLRHSYLEHPVKARFVRIHVVDWHGKSFIIFFKKISNSFSNFFKFFFNFFLKVILHCEWKLSAIKIVTSWSVKFPMLIFQLHLTSLGIGKNHVLLIWEILVHQRDGVLNDKQVRIKNKSRP